MRKILAMLLSVMLLLTAAVAETSAPYAPETVLPLVANNRPYRDFARGAISSGEDAIEQAKAWLYLPLFVTNFSAKSEAVDWSAMRAEEGWYVTAYMRNTFVWLLMDEQGRVQAYDFDLLGNASLTYDGALPDNLDEAIASYIRRFVDLNGFVKVADYAREEVTTFGDYAVAVTVQVMLDGTPYRFTMRLDMMAFTSVENANLHPAAAQTQRDILLLMRDNLAEKGIGRSDRQVAETQVRRGVTARLLRVVREVCLAIFVRRAADDLDRVLVGAYRTVGTQAEEERLERTGLGERNLLAHGQRAEGHVVHDAHRELVLGLVGPEVGEHGQHLRQIGRASCRERV